MVLEEVEGDLFSVGKDWSLAHCISVDCRMGKGIAVEFKRRFGGVAELKEDVEAGADIGSCLVLDRGRRHVFYLLTKERARDKPTYEDLEEALTDLAQLCADLKVRRLAMPKIGCGLDKLRWGRVKAILADVFRQSNINIRVYYQ